MKDSKGRFVHTHSYSVASVVDYSIEKSGNWRRPGVILFCKYGALKSVLRKHIDSTTLMVEDFPNKLLSDVEE